jgi:hypothetical protein
MRDELRRVAERTIPVLGAMHNSVGYNAVYYIDCSMLCCVHRLAHNMLHILADIEHGVQNNLIKAVHWTVSAMCLDTAVTADHRLS